MSEKQNGRRERRKKGQTRRRSGKSDRTEKERKKGQRRSRN